MPDSPYLGAPVDLVTGPAGQIANRELVAKRERIAPAILAVAEGVWTVVGLSVSCAHVIDAPDGLIVIDTGGSRGEGVAIGEFLRTVSDRPIAAVIYSHSHYTGGVDGLLGEERVPIHAHARCHHNYCRKHAYEGPAYHYRLMAQYGVPLPANGPDADPIATRADKTGVADYRPPTRVYAVDGECTRIAGEPVVVYTDYSFDTDDSLIVYFPERRVCAHNHLTATFPNIVSIAGGGYRDPSPWLAGLDLMRTLPIDHLLAVHGRPISGADEVHRRLTVFRDALQFVYDQSIRGMNRGLDADDLLASLTLPVALRDDPAIAQSYSEWQFGVRGVYAGLLGWYSGDAVDLHPVPPQVESDRIVAGFGGLDAVLDAVERELAQHCWAWAAKLARHAVRVAAEGSAHAGRARQLLAAALRAMGHASPAWTTRNVYLTQAGEWEGRWHRCAFPYRIDPAVAATAPAGTFVRALGFRLDPSRMTDLEMTVAIVFDDGSYDGGVHIRRGVAEYLIHSLRDADLRIVCSRADWLAVIVGGRGHAWLAERATVTGTGWQRFWGLFDVAGEDPGPME